MTGVSKEDGRSNKRAGEQNGGYDGEGEPRKPWPIRRLRPAGITDLAVAGVIVACLALHRMLCSPGRERVHRWHGTCRNGLARVPR